MPLQVYQRLRLVEDILFTYFPYLLNQEKEKKSVGYL